MYVELVGKPEGRASVFALPSKGLDPTLTLKKQASELASDEVEARLRPEKVRRHRNSESVFDSLGFSILNPGLPSA